MEKDKPKNLLILVYLGAICFGIVATVIFVYEYFRADVRREYEQKVLAAPHNELRDLRAREEGRLSKYQWVDQGRGIVRIPLDRAKELVLKEWEARPAGLVPLAPADGAAPGGGTTQPVTPTLPTPDAPGEGIPVPPPAPPGSATPTPAAPAPAAPAPAPAPAAPAPAGAPR